MKLIFAFVVLYFNVAAIYAMCKCKNVAVKDKQTGIVEGDCTTTNA